MPTAFTTMVMDLISRIPSGRVATYGSIALAAGNPRAARQVARILHSCSDKGQLPWHRVVNRDGQISLPRFGGYELQKQLLEQEGVVFDQADRINLEQFHWKCTGR
ncbi:MAG: MGMT family protein [Candidatus Delongbacteria bacterium]|nr:MGMT family protein [Candidatus Delongbacteria bacterium]